MNKFYASHILVKKKIKTKLALFPGKLGKSFNFFSRIERKFSFKDNGESLVQKY